MGQTIFLKCWIKKIVDFKMSLEDLKPFDQIVYSNSRDTKRQLGEIQEFVKENIPAKS